MIVLVGSRIMKPRVHFFTHYDASCQADVIYLSYPTQSLAIGERSEHPVPPPGTGVGTTTLNEVLYETCATGPQSSVHLKIQNVMAGRTRYSLLLT